MAEGLARRRFGPGVRIASAGSRPTALNPYAVSVLAEIGIDIAGQRAKGMESVAVETFELVVTLCAEEECPVLPPGSRRLHWPIDDPAAHAPEASPQAILTRFRRARDAIAARLDELAVAFRSASTET